MTSWFPKVWPVATPILAAVVLAFSYGRYGLGTAVVVVVAVVLAVTVLLPSTTPRSSHTGSGNPSARSCWPSP
jgi:hypothetical protein